MSTETESGKKLKSEIDRRARDTTKLIALEAQKVAIGEMVLERLDTILDLLRAAGFKIVKATVTTPAVQAVPPPNTVVVQASQLAEQTTAPVKNPCSVCGLEATHSDSLPDGSQKFYCRTHAQQRAKEKAEEQQTASLFHGNTGTMFARPQNPNRPAPPKVIIQADPPDLLKGRFPNGAQPPPNSVLDDD
jgi:hypothetical protein